MKRFGFSLVAVIVIVLSTAISAFAQEDRFYITHMTTVGCADAEMGVSGEIEQTGDFSLIRTKVTVGDTVYMDAGVNVIGNGSFHSWKIDSTFTYSNHPDAGTFPLPVGEPVRLDFTFEVPKGNVLYSWTTILDSCDTGNFLYNDETPVIPEPVDPIDGACSLSIPEGSVVGEAPNGAQIYYAPGHATNLSLNPGTYIVTGQDESETYYQIVLACETRWVHKDSLQPSYQAPQNGAPLPTRIVG